MTPSENEGTKSSRGSKILKALVKQKTKSMDTNQKGLHSVRISTYILENK